MGDGEEGMPRNVRSSGSTKSISKVCVHSINFLKAFLRHRRSDFRTLKSFTIARIIRLGQESPQSPHMKFPPQSPRFIDPDSKNIAEAFEMYRNCVMARASGKFLLVEGQRQSWLIGWWKVHFLVLFCIWKAVMRRTKRFIR